MKFLHDYIEDFHADEVRQPLGQYLHGVKRSFDVITHDGTPQDAFQGLVDAYNWLGNPENKRAYAIDNNLARNLPGALLQDYLLHLVMELCEPYPQLEFFTEVRVPFGSYPIWRRGAVTRHSPAEKSDLAVGYLTDRQGTVIPRDTTQPNPPHYSLPTTQSVLPLVTVNTKIRVSQSEFFDWLGREQLMTKGNPHCLSVQVALRKEMDMGIVEAAQAGEKFFLLGVGTERNVTVNPGQLDRFVETVSEHLRDKMAGHPGEI